jgi:site-specific recombinase XerD
MRTKNTIKYLTTEEIDRFFACIKDPRDRALFRIAYHRGLRASEIGKLQLADYRASVGRLYIARLKGSNAGEFRLTSVEQTSLRAWIRERGQAPGPLFPSRNRRAISRWRVAELMQRYCALAGIAPDKAHPHALKHSCATHLLEMESDITIVQDWLGHKDIRSTMEYAKITNRKRDEAASRLNDWGRKRAA